MNNLINHFVKNIIHMGPILTSAKLMNSFAYTKGKKKEKKKNQ